MTLSNPIPDANQTPVSTDDLNENVDSPTVPIAAATVFSAAMKRSSMPAMAADRDGNLLFVNTSARQILGLADESDHPMLNVLDFERLQARREGQRRLEAVLSARHWEGVVSWQNQSAGGGVRLDLIMSLCGSEDSPQILIFGRDVTKRESEMETLTREHNRFRSLVENAPDMTYIVDLRQRITYASPSLTRRLGYSAEELTDQHASVFVEERDRARHARAIEIHGRWGHIPAIEFHVRCKSGETLPVEMSSALLRGPNGRVEGVQAVLRDITRRSAAEVALKRRVEAQELIASVSARLFNLEPEEFENGVRSAVEAIGRFFKADRCAFALFDASGRRIEETSEWKRNDVEFDAGFSLWTARREFNWISDQLNRLRTARIQSADSGPSGSSRECEWLARQGIRMHLSVPLGAGDRLVGVIGLDSIAGERDWDDRAVNALRISGEMLIGSFNRRNALQALRDSEAKHRAMVENSLAGVVMVRDERIIFANRAAEEMLGRSSKDLEHLPVEEIFADTPSGRQLSMERHRLKVQGQPSPRQYETQIQAWDGRIRDVILSSVRIEIEGRPSILSLFHDISPLKDAERKLVQAHEELETRVADRTADLRSANKRLHDEIADRMETEKQLVGSLREKEALLREVHHRVKNNLQVVLSLLQLQIECLDDEQTRGVLEEIKNRVRSMGMLHEILYQSRDLGQLDYSNYIGALTSHLVHSYQGDSSRIAIENQVADVTLTLDAAVALGLIINELVSNALKHAFPNGMAGQVRVSLREEDRERLRLRVCDNGVGLENPEQAGSIHTLGLQLVEALTAQLRGVCEVGNDPGACFTILFPKPDPSQENRLNGKASDTDRRR